MWKYTLPNANDWTYFYGVDAKPTPHNLMELPLITKNIFPELIETPLKIVNGNLVNAPMSFPENAIIFLNTATSDCYSQTIYQIGHELCHMYIKANPIDRNFYPNTFWFEETLCEISSHLFLEEYLKIKGWDDSNKTMRYDAYSEYMLSDTFIEPFNTKELFMAYHETDQYMRNHSTDRCKNRYIAKILLPIFRENRNLLQELPKLRNLYTINDFRTFLSAWKDAANSQNKPAIQKIMESLEFPGQN
ncbi:TPA: hypothetical protein ACGOYW_001522 [Streptococcus suis]